MTPAPPERWILNLFAGFVLAVSLGACGPRQTEEPVPPLRVDAATAASVNGEPVFQDDLLLEAAAQGVVLPGEPFEPEHPEYDTVLDQLIDQKLLAQEAVRRDLTSDPAAQRRLKIARERILGNLLVESLVAGDVTEARIQEMYAEQVALQQLDDEVRLSQIIVETEDDAAEVIARLEDGDEFAIVARDFSIDTRSRLEGGSLGYVRPADFTNPYAAMIADTPTGKVSRPFETDLGWTVLRVDDRRTEAPQTLEEMRPEIVTFLTYSQISRILRELRTEADIQRVPGQAADGVPDMDAPSPTENEGDPL